MKREQLLQTAKPILFNTEMVRAIFDGKKTQTRRVVGDVGIAQYFDIWTYHKKKRQAVFMGFEKPIYINYKYDISDILYIKETWAVNPEFSDEIIYKADDTDDDWKINYENFNWKPSLFIPKEYARLFLKVTNVRVERLQDISNEDCLKEGVKRNVDGAGKNWYSSSLDIEAEYDNPIYPFRLIWNKTAKDGYKWEDNPYVFVYEFEKILI